MSCGVGQFGDDWADAVDGSLMRIYGGVEGKRTDSIFFIFLLHFEMERVGTACQKKSVDVACRPTIHYFKAHVSKSKNFSFPTM